MNKRGGFVGFVLSPMFVTLIALGIVLVYMLWFVGGVGKSTTFEKNFLATDLALLIDTIPAMPQPGNLLVFYNPQRSEKFKTTYGFRFLKNKAEVITADGDTRPGIAYYTSDPAMDAEERTFTHSDIMIVPVFVKHESGIAISDLNKRDYDYHRALLTCGTEDYRRPLAAVASHASGAAAPIEQFIAQAFSGMQAGTPQSTIAVRIADAPAAKPVVKALVASTETPATRRLACELANQLVKTLAKNDIEASGAAVVSVNPAHTATDADTFLAQPGNVLIELHITPEQLSTQDRQRAVATALHEGVKHAQT
jgi:hypothetical protein